ncbi:MAG: hypothetical protein ACOYON_12205 [Fimbriimonas sp.]
MGALSWVRLLRRVPGATPPELVHVEALIDAEDGRQPTQNLYILSIAIPAGIATFGGLSVFAAWVSGNTGQPLLLGTALTLVLAAGAWFTFYRLYQAMPPAKRRLRDLILKFSARYASFGNIVLGQRALSDAFATLLDEVAGIYLRHCTGEDAPADAASVKARSAIEDTLSKLLEVALKDHAAQTRALTWGLPIVEELRLLDSTLTEHAITMKRDALADPLANLRELRAELTTSITSVEELDQHLKA